MNKKGEIQKFIIIGFAVIIFVAMISALSVSIYQTKYSDVTTIFNEGAYAIVGGTPFVLEHAPLVANTLKLYNATTPYEQYPLSNWSIVSLDSATINTTFSGDSLANYTAMTRNESNVNGVNAVLIGMITLIAVIGLLIVIIRKFIHQK